MNHQLKIQLALVIFIMHVLVYYYILPDYSADSVKSNVSTTPQQSQQQQQIFTECPSEIYCRISWPTAAKFCESGLGVLKTLGNQCGQAKVPLPPVVVESPPPTVQVIEEIKEDKLASQSWTVLVEEVVEETPVDKDRLLQVDAPNNVETPQVQTPKEDYEVKLKEDLRQNTLIYQIIVVLLIVSVTASLADCFQERARRKAEKAACENSGIGGNRRNDQQINRRMSLADLTMSRHARRESQASYRPPGKIRTTRQQSVSWLGPS